MATIRLDTAFWAKVIGAMERVIGAAVLFGAHLGLSKLIHTVVSYDWLSRIFSGMFLVGLTIIYFTLLLEMVSIFLPVPAIRRKKEAANVEVTE